MRPGHTSVCWGPSGQSGYCASSFVHGTVLPISRTRDGLGGQRHWLLALAAVFE